MLKRSKITIGSRIVKSSAAAAVSLLIAESLELDFASLAVVAAVITLQPTFYETLEMVRNRLLGALIGTMLALPFVYFINIDPSIEVFAGVMIILVLMNAMSVSGTSVLGVIAFVSIVTIPDATYITMIDRIINTLIGGGTSIVINLITPVQSAEEKSADVMKRALQHDMKLLSESLKAIAGDSSINQDELSRLTNKIINELTEAYRIGTILRREQPYINDSESYLRFDEKYHTLWDIHNYAMHILIEKDQFLENGYSVSNETSRLLAEFAAILDEVCVTGIYPNGLKTKAEDILSSIEASLAKSYSGACYADVFKEGGFYAVLMSGLRRFSENLGNII